MPIKRDVVKNAPTLLHTVALVGINKHETIRNIRKMDVASPPSLYGPARQLVHKVLSGQCFDWARRQANLLIDPAEKKCALVTLDALEKYLISTKPQWFRPLDIELYQLSADLQIPVRVDGLLKVGDETRVLCLHLWQKRLTTDQMRAAITVLGERLSRRPELVESKLEILDISIDASVGERLLRKVGWETYSFMSNYELEAFMGRLLEAWQEYHLNPAEKPKWHPKPSSDGQGEMFPGKPEK
jgi:hypothetical protein